LNDNNDSEGDKILPGVKSALQEYKSQVNPKSKIDKSKLLLSSSKNFVSKAQGNDSLVDMNKAKHLSQKARLLKLEEENNLFELGNAPELEPVATSWFSWIPSIWCCSSQAPSIAQSSSSSQKPIQGSVAAAASS